MTAAVLTLTASPGYAQTPLPNPPLAEACGLDIVLVIDGSGSVDSTEYAQMQAAFVDFVEAFLVDSVTPTQFALVELATGAVLRQGFTGDATTIIDEINEPRVQPSGQFTNWDGGLYNARILLPNRGNPDLIVFSSDGNPNRRGGHTALGHSASIQTVSEGDAMSWAIAEANAAKTAGARIVAVGIGNDLDTGNLEDVSSADAVITSNFSQLAEDLAALAIELCAGTVTAHKVFDIDGNLATLGDQSDGESWTFTANVDAPDSATPPSGATDAAGLINFDIDLGINGLAVVDIVETLKPNYTFLSASCTDQSDAPAGTPGALAVNNISIGADDIISCTFYNQPDCSYLDDECVEGVFNPTTEECETQPVAGPCDDGLFCTTGDTCTAGVCGGTPLSCNDGVSCTVDSCSEAADTCVHTPNHAVCSNGAYCDGAEVCDLVSGCQAGPAIVCSDGIFCTLDTCNEATDSCTHVANHGACNDFQYCNGVESCDLVHGCEAGTPVDCNDGVACTVDSCDEVADVCSNSPNHGACSNGQFCDGVEVCDPDGGCEPGSPIDCGDGVPCTVDTCNEAADQCDHAPNHASCSNGEFCDGTEVCDPVNDCQAGTAPNCGDGVSCTTDACNELTDQCDHAPDDAVCSNGQYCDGAETCDPVNDCEPGTPVSCDDDVSCTVDTCNEATDQCNHAPNDTVCVNGEFCDGIETCDPVNDCQPGTDPCVPLSCSEVLDQCVMCLTDAQCDNGEFCDGVETCNEGTGMCVPGTPVTCNDGIACTTDSCDEDANACAYAPNDGACSNGLYCDGVETCNPSGGCQAGTPVVCVDTVACTVDSCNEAQDRCNYVPDNTLCSDGQFCNGVEVCSLTLGCRPGTALTCTDGISCTLDSCNETLDQCEHVPNDALCSDGLFCNGAEVCDPVNRCVSAPPVVCTDGVGCTNDFCNEVADRCESTPNHALCTNGLYCDGNEVCDPINGCGPGVPVDCSDDNACTANSCYEAGDMCLAEDICCGNGSIDIGEECDDGNLEDADGCDSNCKYTRCGNGIVTPGEECEYTEICGNLLDDDEDGFFDCADPDCEVENCTAECELAPPCTCIEEDPAIVLLNKSPNFFRLHGRIPGDVFTIDPQEEGVTIQLSNADGVIYEAMLPPSSFVMRSPTRFSFKDKTAVTGVDPVGPHAGLAQLYMQFRVIEGVSYLTFKIKAYGDFSEATLPCMTTQVTVGDDLAALRADWTLRKAGAWWLRRGDYVCPSTCASEPR